MCGIAGFVGEGNKEILVGMVAAISHRGPDDTGLFYEGEVGFAHARLSIVDLSETGHQPMKSVSGKTTIIFNGEIYNYKLLRKELEVLGRSFRSTSDTEVILEGYETYGTGIFEKLDGMFALALFDHDMQVLYLARDRMGEKPLYFVQAEGTLVFASEVKAILQYPRLHLELAPDAVASYLSFDSVLTPESMYQSVQKLPAATFARYEQGVLTQEVYWRPSSRKKSISFEVAKRELDRLLEESVRSQMVADVDVGVFLSGGLDSSLVAYFAKKGNSTPVHTFSLGFEEESYDESTYAREVAEALGTVHHEYIVSAADVRAALPAVVALLDEPIADPAMLPNYLLSRFAREHVKVVLGGDGADELFSGYPTFTAEWYLKKYLALPFFLRRGIIEPIVRALPVSHNYFSFDFKAKQFLRGAYEKPAYVHQAWLASFSPEELEHLLLPEFRAKLHRDPRARLDDYLAEVPFLEAHAQTAYLYLRTYLLDDILVKVDRASMMVSLEVRAPFLSHKLVEFALTLPSQFKRQGSTGKYILRELMRSRLPSRVLARGKHGFGLPLGEWFKGPWEDLLRETLSREHLEVAGIFSPAYVLNLIEEHVAGVKNHRKALWSLLVFQLWYDSWINNHARAE